MRATLLATVLCCSMSGIAATADADASIRKSIDIPAQGLGPALRALAKDRDLHVIFVSEDVAGRNTRGVNGQLTANEALTQLLNGTGLTYRYIDTNTVTIVPAAAGADGSGQAPKPREGAAAVAEDGSAQLRLAQEPATAAPANGPAEAPAPASGTDSTHEIVVTGTWLQQTSPTSPVINYTREEIERGGYTSLQDLMARVPQNFSSTNPATGTSGGNVGLTTQIDLRGLGSQSTLTLVNGRRVAPAAGNSGRAFDIAMIPVAAVERVDILTDGASALYGSDAIAGVVNVMLRRDFQGAETTLQYDDGSAGGSSVLVSQVFGTSWNGGYLLAAGQYDTDDPVTYQGIGLTSKDFRSRGGADFRVPGFGSPGTVYPGGYFAGQPFTTLTGPGGAPVFYATLPAGDGANVQMGQLGLNQMTAYNATATDVTTDQENTSLYLTAEQTMGPVTLFADGVFAKREGLQRLGPNSTYLTVPAANPFSPFDETVLVGYVLGELGDIEALADSEGWFANIGVRGELGGGWSWELAGARSEDDFTTGVASLDNAELSRRLGLTDPLEAFNPFGDGSSQRANVIAALVAPFFYHGSTQMSALSTQLQGRLFDLPGGTARLAVGGEYREEDMNTLVSRPNAPDSLLFPNASRDNHSIYAEAWFPLVSAVNARRGVRELAVSAAGRYERYSDFGSDTNPKLGLLWQPREDLGLKATWGTSFRAPALRELFSVSRVSPNYAVFDPRAPGGARTVFVDYIFGGSTSLGPESAETYSLSAEYRPQWLEGSRFTLSHYDIRYIDRIRGSGDGLTPAFMLSIEDDLPAGIIQRDPDGTLRTLNLVNVNIARANISGYDLAAGYRWEAGAFGRFALDANGTFFRENTEELAAGAPVLDRRGKVGSPPQWRAHTSLSWNRGEWGANAGLNYVDGLYNDSADPRTVLRAVDSQTTVDVQVSYVPEARGSLWLDGVSLRLGALNVFDAGVPFVDSSNGFDPRNHIFTGRTLYLRAAKTFGAAR